MASLRTIVPITPAPSARPVIISGDQDHRIAKQRRYRHTASEWESRRAEIIQLYTEDRKTADEVVHILKSSFGFNTGRRQLYTKLDEWGIKKNKKRQSEDSNNFANDVSDEITAGEIPLDSLMQDVSFTPLTQYVEMSSKQPTPDISSQSTFQLPRLDFLDVDNCQIRETEALQWDSVSLAAIDFRTPEICSDHSGTPSWPWMKTPPPLDSRLADKTARDPFEMESPLPIFGDDEANSMPTSESIPTTGDESRRMSFDTISPLEESLREVIEFISSKEGTMRHSKSINFKRNVGTLLERVHTMVVQNSSDVSISRYSDNHSLDEGLALTKNLLTSAPTATLNTYKPVEVSQGMIPTRVVWKRRWKKICLGSTTLTIIEKTTGRFSDQDCDDDDDDTPSTDWHFGTKVTFRPKNSTRMLQIEVQQYQFSFMGLTMPPRFIVNNIRPDDSLVFKIAEYGSVDDLLHLFSTGQASLRDCDERGASLLYYGLRNPPVCKLLVEEGLDVDEWIVTKQGYYRTLLHIAMLGPSEGRCSLDTGRILLSAGADPNERGPRWRSVIDVLTGKEHKTERDFSGIQQVFDHAPHFVLSDSFEGSVIHNLCGENRGIISRGLGAVEPDRLIELALKRGCPPGLQADIGSPLHACFRADLPPPSEANWLKALVRLVQNGTDIFAVDMWGVPVSDIAYAWPVCYEYDDCDLSLGSYREDLFDALLGVCHYNIADFRNNRPRIARYTGSYRRQDFEKLWEGHEALCPYWDDDVWPALPEQAAVENSDDGKVLCVCNYRNPTQWIGVDDPPTGCCFVNPESDDSDFWSSASGFDSGEDMSEGDINEDDI